MNLGNLLTASAFAESAQGCAHIPGRERLIRTIGRHDDIPRTSASCAGLPTGRSHRAPLAELDRDGEAAVCLFQGWIDRGADQPVPEGA